MAIENLLHLSPTAQLGWAVFFVNGLLPFFTVRSACRRELLWVVPLIAATLGVASVTIILPDAGNLTALFRLFLAGTATVVASVAAVLDA
ncbi:hypothetical protein RN01_21350 [Cupriavidus sp. SHE]|uniref:hypothetical protein n=1 Tax=Cupriavidus TaxID=106589 RepID=UPI00055C4D77|nr:MULTISPECIES: hypothetical protein [Cupriavidus]KWR79409.1 hypothetical protein RN01_21350 [Cupriavidus sp. SHE]GMG95030.1 hypothetical protein Cmtc_62500 [Cupriavidus sp. TKC]